MKWLGGQKSGSLSDTSWIQKAIPQLHKTLKQLLQMTKYITTSEEFYHTFLHAGTATDKCWGEKALPGLPLASYPGLLTPTFVACSTNAGEGLVKLSHMVWHTWTCGGVAHFFCTAVKRLSESKKRHQDCLMSSAQPFYGPCLQSVAHSFTCCFSGNVPLLHTSRYVIPMYCKRQTLGWEGLGTMLAFLHVSTASNKC